jgi:Fe-S oxidoreductase
VAAACTLFEDYLERAWRSGTVSLDLAAGPDAIVLHGHCHQRAMGLVPSAASLLARVPSARVIDLDAGCCGLAGSFGYTREHYEVSRLIGERRLFPAARTLSPASALVAAGTSCRHQVAHFTGAQAVHPAALLRSLLRDRP